MFAPGFDMAILAAAAPLREFEFRSRRPFHPGRLNTLLSQLSSTATGGGGGPLAAVHRGSGTVWLGSENGMTQQGGLKYSASADQSSADLSHVYPAEMWWAALPKDQWPEGLAEDLAAVWKGQSLPRVWLCTHALDRGLAGRKGTKFQMLYFAVFVLSPRCLTSTCNFRRGVPRFAGRAAR